MVYLSQIDLNIKLNFPVSFDVLIRLTSYTGEEDD